MRRVSRKKVMINWLKKRKISLGLTFLFILDYWLVAFLMQLDLSATSYSTFLAICIGLPLCLWDMRQDRIKYESLLSSYENRMYHLGDLPEAKDFIEESYQELVWELFNDVRQAQEEADLRAQETKDYYTLWTHQIKTPIAAMKLILQNKKHQEKVLNLADTLTLEEELFKIEQYVEMVLQYQRLESISGDLVLKHYRLYDIVSKALQKYAICFIGKKLSIEVQDFDEEVVTDEKWLQFVIEQLISNSMKYTVTGGITIRMRDAYTLEISDTGIGIQEEDLPRIFEKGFTGFNGRMDHKSTGIGLYLCKKVTNKLSHSLEVTSTLGKGTSFYIGFAKNEAVDMD